MLNKIRNEMKKNNIETILLNSYENNKVGMNLFYATGFTGSSCSILVSEEFAYFVTDFRYQNMLGNLKEGFEIVIQKPGQAMFDVIAELTKKHNVDMVHIDPNMYFAEAKLLEKDFGLKVESFGSILDDCRNVKMESELEFMRKACDITDKAYSYLLEITKPGMTEIELSRLLENKMIELGASKKSFDTILVSGTAGASPHGVPSDKKVANGELVTVDFGCYFGGYASDMTRTFAIGDVEPKLVEMYNVVLEAQLAGVAAVKAGAKTCDIDFAARSVIDNAGYGEYFGHGTGHGLGIDVHEAIRIAKVGDQILEPGMVITIEPGIYIPGIGGVRIEDDVVVTETGCEILNKSDKNLIKI